MFWIVEVPVPPTKRRFAVESDSAGLVVPIPTRPPPVVSIENIGVIEVEVEMDQAFTARFGMVEVALAWYETVRVEAEEEARVRTLESR